MIFSRVFKRMKNPWRKSTKSCKAWALKMMKNLKTVWVALTIYHKMDQCKKIFVSIILMRIRESKKIASKAWMLIKADSFKIDCKRLNRVSKSSWGKIFQNTAHSSTLFSPSSVNLWKICLQSLNKISKTRVMWFRLHLSCNR